MGSYAGCWLDSLYVGSTKNHFDPTLMQLFRASDERQVHRKISELPVQVRGWSVGGEDDNSEIDVVYYEAPARVIKDRLELKGYTFEICSAAFLKCIRAEAARYSEYSATMGGDFYQPIASMLEVVEVDSWLDALREI